MITESNENNNESSENNFEFEVLRLLASTCDKHIHSLSERKWVQPSSSDPDISSEEVKLNSLSNIISSLLYDFSRNLQSQTCLFNTFELVETSCDSIKKKLKVIKYSKWNRINNKNYKNVYYKILKKSLDPTCRVSREQDNDHFKIIFKRFERVVNIWAHHVLYDDLNVEKSYNEPPQVQVITFDMSGDVIITGGSEGMIKLWDVYSCKNIMSLKRHSGAITNIDVHPTNAFIVSSCEGGEIWLWEVNNNFYRPHRMLKSTYKFLWVRFLVNDRKLDLKKMKGNGKGKLDHYDRTLWEVSLDETLIVSLDASSTLRVYKMRDLLSSSAGDNVYTEVTPLYYLDLFNHNITAYDLSKSSFNGTFLTAIGIEPLDKQDFENVDLDCINTAINYIKNDTFHKSNLNIKGRYRDLIGKSGFALLMIPLNDATELTDATAVEDMEQIRDDSIQYEEDLVCCCDTRLDSSVSCISTCVFCGKQKYRENKRVSLSISHYDGNEAVEPPSVPKSMFLWTSENSSELEKFCNEAIPDFTFLNNESFENNTPNIPTMHYGKLSSSLILPSCLGSCLGSERESEHFDKLFLNFVNDAHILSPDVCFANTSTDHISASDDAKIFLWSYEGEVFKSIQLTTKTIERWRRLTSGKAESTKQDVRGSSATNISSSVQERTHKSNQKSKSHNLSDQYKSTYSSSSKFGASGEKETQTSISNNTLYVVVSLCWSSRDKYVCVADSMVSKYNYKKSIAQARTNLSGLSFFTGDGRRISDFLHDVLSYHVSCVAFNPVCEEVCLATSYDGLIAILDVKEGVILKKMSFGTSSIWLDVQWHPMGHKFVASQKYGSFSLFSSDASTVFEKTPTFQSTYLDFYCNSISYANSAYTGPESNNIKLRKYYSSFSNVPITINGDSSYEKITKSLEGGPVVFLDERKNNVVVHTIGGFRRWPPVSYYSVPDSQEDVNSSSGTDNSVVTSISKDKVGLGLNDGDVNISTNIGNASVDFNGNIDINSENSANIISGIDRGTGENNFTVGHLDSGVASSSSNISKNSVDLNLIYSTMKRLDGFQEYFEGHYQTDESGDLTKIVKQYLHLLNLVGRCTSEVVLAEEGMSNYEVGSHNDKLEYRCYLGDCAVCENYLTETERAQKYSSVKDSFVQLKCLTDNNGNILRAIPPSARPQDFAETLTPEAVMTPPGRADVESLVETSRLTRYRVHSSPLSDQQVLSNQILQSSLALENNLFWGSSTDTISNEQVDQMLISSSPVEQLQEETTLEVDEEEADDADFELDQDEDEEEEEEEYDEGQYSEEDFIPESRVTRSTKPSRSKAISATRPTRSSTRKVKSELEEVKEDSEEDSDERKDAYSFRRKRGRYDSAEERQIKWARNLSLTIGAVAVKNAMDWREDFSGKICVFCGIGESGDYSKLTRTQSQKLSTTIFSRGNEFNPGCALFKNKIVGPIGIPRRFHSDLDEYLTMFKRVESSSNMFSHVSCLLTSTVKIDASNKLLNFPEVLVQCSFDVCTFCGSKFATVTCESCEAMFHYPCSIAQYEEFKRKAKGGDIVNHYDALVCSEFICVKCAIKDENEYLTSDCFLEKKSREWLMIDDDSFENKFNIQIGDCVVLTNGAMDDGYNVHITWLTQKQVPILAKVLDITYIFTERSTVMACVLMGSFFEEFEEFCIFVTEKTKLVLLRDYLLSIYKLTQIEIGSKIKCIVNGEFKELEVRGVKGITIVDEPLESGKEVDMSTLKKIVSSSYALGHNAVSVQDGDKTKWIDSWQISVYDMKDVTDETCESTSVNLDEENSNDVTNHCYDDYDNRDTDSTPGLDGIITDGYPDDEIEYTADSTGSNLNGHVECGIGNSIGKSSTSSRNGTTMSVGIEHSSRKKHVNKSNSTGAKSKNSLRSVKSDGLSTIVSINNVADDASKNDNDNKDNKHESVNDDKHDDEINILINEIKLNTFLEIDRSTLMDLLGEEKYENFYNIEESESSEEEWLKEYWKSITKPICIKQIVERLFNQYYRTPEGMCGDISLMISNCINFNEPSSKYSKLGNELGLSLKKIKETFQSTEEWKVIVSYLWPKIKNVVNLSDVTRKPKSSAREHVDKVEQTNKSGSKNKIVQVERPTRRSARLQKSAEKVKKEVAEKKKTRYNLR